MKRDLVFYAMGIAAGCMMACGDGHADFESETRIKILEGRLVDCAIEREQWRTRAENCENRPVSLNDGISPGAYATIGDRPATIDSFASGPYPIDTSLACVVCCDVDRKTGNFARLK